MKSRQLQISDRFRRAAFLSQILVIVMALFGLLLGPVMIYRTALAETTAVPSAASITEMSLETAVESSGPSPLTAMVAITGTEQAMSVAQAEIVAPLLATCATPGIENLCVPRGSNGRVAPDLPPELVATLRGEPSPLRLNQNQPEESPSLTAATLTVANTSMTINGDVTNVTTLQNSPGPDGISFLEALAAVNNSGSGNFITFDPILKGQTIFYTRTLYLEVDDTTIDGDVDADGTPDIHYEGPVGYASLSILSADNTITGMAISALSLDGNNATGNSIQNNFIGVGLDGKTPTLANANGIQIVRGSNNNQISNNIIAGNTMPDASKDASGILIGVASHDNRVYANVIGIYRGGYGAANEIGVGISWGAYANLIGGDRLPGNDCSDPCNLISGNTRNGILLLGAGTDNNVIKGNFIGTNSVGYVEVPNQYPAIWIGGGAQKNTIGGSRSGSACTGPCNLISGNQSEGVVISGQGTMLNTVAGNYIGVNLSGLTALPNGSTGVLIQQQASKNLIGGIQLDSSGCTLGCNIISGNKSSGIGIINSGTTLNGVQGNYIGADQTGTSTIGNGDYGVAIANASENVIGKSAPTNSFNEGNHIYGNKAGGILVARQNGQPDLADQNRIMENLFYKNGGPQIDLWPGAGFGVDGTDGANRGQLPPILTRKKNLIWSGGVLAPDGSIVELFGENGRTFLASTTVSNQAFSFDLTGKGISAKPPFVAAVTTPDGNTSEFSAIADFQLSTIYAFPNQKIFAFGVITNPITTTLVERDLQNVKIYINSAKYSAANDGNNDLFKDDDYFSGWVTAPTATGTYEAALNVNDIPVAKVTFHVIQNPKLVVLTDIEALRDEFINVSNKAEAMKIHPALRRIADYAAGHRGIVVDVSADISGYAALNYYRPSDRVTMGQKIDQWIGTKLAMHPTLSHIAIIGDDAVIPFYRDKDEICRNVYAVVKGKRQPVRIKCEQDYAWSVARKAPGLLSNPTMRDMAFGYRLADVHYATRAIGTTSTPVIDYALGRIFFGTPDQLIAGINSYEEPITLNGKNESASVFHLPDRKCTRADLTRCIAAMVKALWLKPMRALGYSTVIPVTSSGTAPIASATLYRFGETVRWRSSDINASLAEARLTTFLTHGSQFRLQTRRGPNYDVSTTQSLLVASDNTPVLSGVACHVGLSTSRKGLAAVYFRSLPTGFMNKYIPYISPMNYASPIAVGMEQQLLLAMGRHLTTETTIGEIFREAQNGFGSAFKPAVGGSRLLYNYLVLKTRYNFILYGLPTQPVRPPSNKAPRTTAVAPGPNPNMIAATTSVQSLDVTVNVPDFQKVTLADGRTYFQAVNNSSLSQDPTLPILPEIRQIYQLPISSTVTSVALTGVVTHTYPLTITPATAVAGTLNGDIFPGSSPLTQTYPAQVYWYGAVQLDGRTLLHLGVNPMQYDPATQQVTLYDQVQLRITYQAPDANASLTGITVNNGSAVNTGMSSLPLRFDVNSAQAANLSLDYEIYDMAGIPLASGTTDVNLNSGGNVINLTDDTLGWHPGPMLLTAELRDGSDVIATRTAFFTVQGRSLAAASDLPYYSSQNSGLLTVEVYDQDGRGVSGLGGTFTATLDAAPLSLSFSETVTGNYQSAFSLAGLSEGIHTLEVGLSGTGTAQVVFDVDQTPPTATLAALPLNFPGLAIPVSGTGSDAGSGVNYFEIQYAVGTTATWTTWITTPVSTEDYPSLDPVIFGPYAPIATQYNQWVYFRVRAVDNAGNAATFPANDYIETYLLQNPPVEQAEAIAKVVELTNQVRASQNPPLPPLKLNLNLNASSQEHSDDTAYNGLSSHTGSDGSAPEDRIYRSGYDYLYAGENWAAGQQTPTDVVNAWVNSPAHFANLVNSLYREIGVGYTFYPLDTNNSFHYWVQNFGAREDVYPVIINGEAETTSSTAVTLYIYGQGWAQDMRISNDPAFTGASWQPYADSVNWTLASGQGERAVYVELRKSITETQVVSDTILLNVSPPRGIDLSVTKMDAPDPVQAGEPLTYTLLVANQGPSAATGVMLFDTLPANVALQSVVATWGYCDDAAGTITCEMETLAAGEQVTVTIIVVPNQSAIGVLSNTAVLIANETDANSANNSATAATTVKGGGAADLVVTKTDSPDPAYLGTITYDIRLENQGPYNALSPVLTDTLPAGMTFGSVQATAGFACAHNSGVVTCSGAVLNNGQTFTVTITATPASEGVYTNTVTASLDSSQFDPDTSNNTATAVTTVANAFIVNVTGDGGDSNTGDGVCNDGSGNCTLRAAIEQANAAAGMDIIAFNIPGSGVHTIQPASALPAITDPVYLDATGQPGYAGTPLIELDGTSAGSFVDGLTIDFGADGSSVRGLAINRFEGSGIMASGANNLTIRDNFIGADPTGTLDQGNGSDGIYLSLSSNNTIADNLLSGNGGNGLGLYSAHQNQVTGNAIGVNFLGLAAIANDFSGILVSGGMTNTIQNNLISGNAWRGIYLFDTGTQNNQVLGNKIGTNALGTAAIPNAAFGIQLENAANNQIGGPNPGDGNLISGNGSSGIMIGDPIYFTTSTDVGHLIQGNKIGTDINGTAALANGDQGIRIGSHIVNSSFHYGGTDIQILDNLISGNTDNGIFIVAATTLVEGNTIGTDISGSAYLGNGGSGIYVGPTYFTHTIKSNLISGNGFDGIEIQKNYWTANVVIQGNTIGTDASGNTTLGNNVYGIEVDGTVLIGGPNPGDGNLISRNGNHGIKLWSPLNTIQGNIIGLNAAANAPLGNLGDGINAFLKDQQTIKDNLIGANQTGIYLGGSSTVQGNIIGTDATGSLDLGNIKFGIDTGFTNNNSITGNTIAFNDYSGILNDSGTQNQISANAIYSNTQLGIDLDNDLVTPNDSGDGDTGGNNLQNFPVLTSAAAGSSGVYVAGTLNSAASAAYRLEFFASPQCDSSGYGEGRDYLGFTTVTTDGSGDASFSISLPTGSTPGYAVTATATDSNGNSSEFSQCATLGVQADLSVSKSVSPNPVNSGSPVTYTVTVANNGPSNASGVVVTDTLPAGVTFGSASAAPGSCGYTGGVVTCTLGVLNGGDSADVTLVVTPTVSGNLTNQAQVAANETDPDGTNNSASVDLAVDPADLTLTGTAVPSPAFSGQPLTYTLTVANSGPLAAANVTLTDTLPGGVNFLSASGGCAHNSGAVTCALGSLSSGGSISATIVVSPTAPGVITNTAVVRADQGDPNLNDNSVALGVTVDPADLTLTKSALSDPAMANQPLAYRVVLTNNGPGTATQIVLTDNLPPGMDFISASSGDPNVPCGYASGTVTCATNSLIASGSVTITINVTPTVTGRITNTISVVELNPDPDTADNSASAGVTIQGGVDLRLAQSAQPDPALYKQPLTYTLVLSNAGALPATGVVLTDRLSAQVSYVSAAATQGSCTQTPAFGGDWVNCSLGSLNPGGTITVTAVVSPTDWGAWMDATVVNTATVRSAEADANPLDNDASLIQPLRDPADGRWDDRFSVPGADGSVTAMTVGSDGALVVSGDFTAIGDVLAYSLARWDGGQWTAVSGGLDTAANALAESNGVLYAGGGYLTFYETNRTSPVSGYLAAWDGSSWSSLSGGVNSTVNALAVGPNGDLYVGGDFTSAGGISVNGLAVWDGSSWADVGGGVTSSGFTGSVNALAVDPATGDLYVAGSFDTAGSVSAANIARWDGSQWHALGSGASGTFARMLVQNGSFYIFGSFWTVGGGGSANAAVWDGSAWTILISQAAYFGGWSGDVYDAAFLGNDLYVAGFFDTLTDGQSNTITAHNIARWNGSSWSEAGSDGVGHNLGSLLAARTVASDGSKLFVGGDFGNAGSVVASHIAQWDGSAWSALAAGQGMPQVGSGNIMVESLATAPNGDIYAGGYFPTAGSSVANHIARWDGSQWYALGSGITLGDGTYLGSPDVRALAFAANGDLYAGGNIKSTATISANYVIRWDGAAWSALGSGMDDNVNALAVAANGDLYAGGDFWTAGGTTVNFVARWNGSAWSALGSGTDSSVYALAIDPNSGDLYVGGTFFSAGGVANTSGIARWDGSQWYEVGGGTGYVYDLAFAANGDLYAAGQFSSAGGVPANTIARWDGSAWHALGGGLTGGTGWVTEARALAVNGSDVYVTGDFTDAGGVPVNGIAHWDGSQWAALGSGLLNPGIGGAAGTGEALAVGDAGLYVGGLFKRAGRKPSYNIGLWRFANPDLTVSQRAAPDPAFSNQPLTYTLTVANNGLLDAAGVVLTDTLPAGVTFGSAASSQGSCGQAGGVVTCALGGLAVGQSAQVQVVVTPVSGGYITNSVTAVPTGQTDMNPTDNSAQATTAVDPADLSLAITAVPAPSYANQPLTYTLTAANNGPLAANGVTLVDTLPGGVQFASASAAPGSCIESGGTVTCALGTLANGGSGTVTLVVTPTQAGVVTNTAVVSASSFDPDSSNNTETHTAVVSPFTETFDNGIPPGWKVVDGGSGQGYAATWTGINPCQRAIASPAANPWLMVDSDCGGIGDEQDEQLISPVYDAAACTSVQVSFTNQFRHFQAEIGDVDVSVDGGSSWVNVLRQQGYDDGYSTPAMKTLDISALAAGNSFQVRFYYRNGHFDWWWAIDDFKVTCSQEAAQLPALSLTNSDLADPSPVGSPLSYQIEVTNAAAYTATGVVISDTLPLSVTFGAATPSQGACNAPFGRSLACPVGDVPPNGSVQVTIVVTPTVSGVITNRARVSANELELVMADNVDTAVTTVSAASAGQFQFVQSGFTVAEDGGTAVITVTRTGGSSGAVTVDYATSDGTATAGSDYTAVSGTLTFADGETSQTFTIPILTDTANEQDETVLLTLSNPTGGASLGAASQATLTIVESGYNVFLPVIVR